MKRYLAIAIGLAFFSALPLAAQEHTPKAELEIGYSYVRFAPSTPQSSSRSFNGGGGAINVVLNHYFGIKAELLGYGSQTASTVLPGGTIKTSGNLFTYLFGPEIKYRTEHYSPFGEVLFGGAHSTVFANAYQASGQTAASPTKDAFAMAAGGGIDIYVTQHIAIRPVQVDYLLTRFTNPLSGTNNQNNFRYQAGIVFVLGEK